MRKIFHNRRGQSITEYSILLGVVIAAFLFMQVPVKWALWPKLNFILDDFKNYPGLMEKPESLYSQDLGSASQTHRDSQTHVFMNKEMGFQVYIRESLKDKASTQGESKYDSYVYEPPIR